MKRVLGLFIAVFAVLLMSHNVSASQRLGDYQNYVSRGITGLPTSIGYNIHYSVSANANGASYVANGEFSSSINWVEGQEYNIIIFSYFSSNSNTQSRFPTLVPEAIILEGNNYHSLDDVVRYNRSCNNSLNCTSVVMHEIKVLATSSGSEKVKFKQSNLYNIADFWLQNNCSGILDFDAKLFDNADEFAEFKTDVLNALNNINSDTSDIVDTLGEINDKLDQLNSNADKNAEGWNNMQHTDGLVDIGDDSQLLSIVGTISTVFDTIKNTPASESCTIASGNTPINMGDINLCYDLPDWVHDLGSFVMTTISFVAVLFMLIGCVNAVNKFMDWARSN